MNREELKEVLGNLFPGISFDESGEMLVMFVPEENFISRMQQLRSDERLYFDFLFCETCVDWNDHLMMVYHLLSKKHRHVLVVKMKIANRDEAVTETVCHIWKTAELHEREVYDMFGVKFKNHPDLRRLFLDENWKGFPLRKDYSDPYMIEL